MRSHKTINSSVTIFWLGSNLFPAWGALGSTEAPVTKGSSWDLYEIRSRQPICWCEGKSKAEMSVLTRNLSVLLVWMRSKWSWFFITFQMSSTGTSKKGAKRIYMEVSRAQCPLMTLRQTFVIKIATISDQSWLGQCFQIETNSLITLTSLTSPKKLQQ